MALRRILKAGAFGVAVLLVSPLIVITSLEKVCRFGDGVFRTCGQGLALVPGPIGSFLRGAFYWTTLDACSWEVRLGFGSVFMHRGASVAANVSTGLYCVLGHVTIGSGVMMASHVSIPSGKRQHLDAAGNITSETRYEAVTVGSRTWIGEGAIILADVGARCIVSAGAIVFDAMPDAVLIAGNPARAVKSLEQRSAPREIA
ncbi:MAG: hypothetical protein ABW110_18300 [Steroidobacteraceae bacterium]